MWSFKKANFLHKKESAPVLNQVRKSTILTNLTEDSCLV